MEKNTFEADMTWDFDKSQDQLTIRTTTVHFSGYEKVRVVEVQYLEYAGEDPESGTSCFNCVNTEYFPADTVTGQTLALQAFMLRLNSTEPHMASCLSMDLDSFLIPVKKD